MRQTSIDMKDLRWELAGQFVFLALAISAFMLTGRIDMAFASDLEIFAGPRRYPRIILAIFISMNVVLIVTTLLRARTLSIPEAGPGDEPGSKGRVRALAVLIALSVFVAVFETLGYLVLTAPLLIFVAVMNKAPLSAKTIIVCLCLTIICLMIFRYALNVVLPEGILGIDMIL